MAAVAFNLGGSKEFNKLMAINNAIINGNVGTCISSDEDGNMFAEFTDYFRGRLHLFRIYTDGVLLFKDYMNDSAEFNLVNVNGVKNNTYPEVVIGGVHIKLYNLVHACFEPNFVDWFVRGKRHVVNHTVLVKDNYTGRLKPNKDVWANMEYTEVVSVSDNNRHSNFVNTHDLHDVYVSAYDIDDLIAEFVLYARAHGVSLYELSYDTKCDLIVAYYNQRRESGIPVPAKVDFRK